MTSQTATAARVTRLNHAVLYVRNLDRAVDFYQRAFGFEVVSREGGMAAFLRAAGGDNHHDLGLFSVGERAPSPPRGAVGLYHLAWEVAAIEDLATMAARLSEMDAIVGASDHGVSKSLYAKDPDGNEFEIMWRVPREAWGDLERRAVVRPLDLAREVAQHGAR